MIQDFLPLSLASDWRETPHCAISNLLRQWLFEQGSLTARLKAHCQQFSVKILAKHQRLFTANELQLFDCPQQQVQVREVLLYCDDKPWVYAQSLMPLEVIPLSVQKLISLGDKPLGEVIFNEPSMIRSPIMVTPFEQHSDVMNFSQHIGQSPIDRLWGRRSLFTIDGYSLLVAEVFLADSGIYDE